MLLRVIALGAGALAGCATGRESPSPASSGSASGGTAACEPAPAEVVALAAGHGFAMVALADGSVWGWGRRVWAADRVERPDAVGPEPIAELAGATSLSARSGHACATFPQGTLRCTGDDAQLELGGAVPAPPANRIVDVPIDGVVASACGDQHTCARREDGSVWCWGLRYPFSDPSSGPPAAASPALVPGVSDVQALSLGTWHSCALDVEGVAWCWGQVGLTPGDGGIAWSPPTAIPTAGSVRQIASGRDATCGILAEDGRSHCWLRSSFSDGLETIGHPTELVLGDDYLGCARLADGGVACAGTFDEGASPDAIYDAAPVVAGVADARLLAVGGNFACAVEPSSCIACWGWNGQGQLGDGTAAPEARPVDHVVWSR